MNLTKKLNIVNIKQLNKIFNILLLILLAIIVEIVVCNGDKIIAMFDNYSRQEIALPYNQSIKDTGIVLNKSNHNIVINGLDIDLNNIYIYTKGTYNTYLKGKISISDENYKYKLSDVKVFTINPGGEHNYKFITVRGRGNVKTIVIDFENITSDIIVSKLVLNEDEKIDFSFVRLLLILIIISSIAYSYQNSLLFKAFDLSDNRLVKLNIIVVAAISALPLLIMFGYFGENTNSILYYFYGGQSGFPITTDEKSFLTKIPSTIDELRFSDPYVVMMDAFSKGQVFMDYPVDPRLNQLNNIMDYSERMSNNIFGFYDASFYKGKWYYYFGIAPLIFYYPVFWVTGMVPTLPFAHGVFAFIASICVAYAFSFLYKFFNLKVSIPIFLLGEISVIIGSFVLGYQQLCGFYTLRYSLSVIIISVYIVALLSQCSTNCYGWKYNTLLVLMAFLVVLQVQNRPNMILILIMLSLPIIIYLIKRDFKVLIKRFVIFILPILIAGGIFTAWFNYIRFENIFEFGIHSQISMFDSRKFNVEFTWFKFINFIYYMFLENVKFDNIFPFYHADFSEGVNLAVFTYLTVRWSLNEAPIMFFILFAFVGFFKKGREFFMEGEPIKLRLLSFIGILSVISSIITSYMSFSMIGVAGSYIFESTFPLVMFGVLLMFQILNINNKHLYCINKVYFVLLNIIFIWFMVTSILYIFFISFDLGFLKGVNPDFYMDIENIFTPFN